LRPSVVITLALLILALFAASIVQFVFQAR
jgi:hypothetical protein